MGPRGVILSATAGYRAGDVEVLLAGVQRGLGGINLCLRFQIFGLSVIQFLLRDQAGLSGRSLFQPGVVGMQGGVFGLCAHDFLLGAGDLILTAGNFRNRALQLSAQFRHFQDSKDLPLTDLVADVDVNVPDVSGDFCVNVDDLK